MKFIFIAFLVLLNSIVTHQQESCTLPSGQKSTCMRLHQCKHFTDILRKYDRGIPPPDVAQNIRSHSCVTGSYLCCPDNAIKTTIPQPEVEIPVAPQELTKSDVDFYAIKNHRNFNLINEKTCGVQSSNRIVGGVDANIREFPWAALIGYKLNDGNVVFQCGGTLISKRFVLTACHCITKELVSVRLGEHTISKQRDCDDTDQCADPVQDIMVETKIKHPLFDRKTKENDIALLKLVKPADLNKNNVRTICLPLNQESDIAEFKKSNMSLIVSGWGKTEGGKSSDILQKAYVPFVDHNTCSAIFNPNGIQIYNIQLCAGYTKDSGNKKIDSCKGDSGGGLMGFSTYNNKPKALLYGVVSGGVKCEDSNKIYPGIYANIRYFLTWILDTISE